MSDWLYPSKSIETTEIGLKILTEGLCWPKISTRVSNVKNNLLL